MKDGRTFLVPEKGDVDAIQAELMDAISDDSRAGVNEKNLAALNDLFPKLRAEAESWNSQRQKYMMARLQKGDHPDTNLRFWNEWKPAAPPNLDVVWVNEGQQTQQFINRSALVVKSVGLFLLAALTGLFVWFIRRSATRNVS